MSVGAQRGFTPGLMDWLTHFIWHDGKFLGVEWHFWKVVGWLGNLLFTSRFLVQWWATEKHKRVVVPARNGANRCSTVSLSTTSGSSTA